MGSRGPLPKRDAVGHRKRTTITVIPRAPDAKLPPPPADLTPESVALWTAFWTSDVAQAVDPASDLGRLERWIRAVDEWHRVGPVFRKSRIVKGSTGQVVLSPLAIYLANLEAIIAAAESQFGMTPVSRARLGLTVGQAKLTAANLNATLNRDGRLAAEAEYAEFEPDQ